MDRAKKQPAHAKSRNGRFGSQRSKSCRQTQPIYTGMVWVTRQVVLWQHESMTKSDDGSGASEFRS